MTRAWLAMHLAVAGARLSYPAGSPPVTVPSPPPVTAEARCNAGAALAPEDLGEAYERALGGGGGSW